MNKFILGAVVVSILVFSNPVLATDNKIPEEISAPEVIMPEQVKKVELSKLGPILPKDNKIVEYEEDVACQQYKNKPELDTAKKTEKPVTADKHNVLGTHGEKQQAKMTKKTPTPSLVISYKIWENRPDPIKATVSQHQISKEYHKGDNKDKYMKKYMKYSKYTMREKDERTAGTIPVYVSKKYKN